MAFVPLLSLGSQCRKQIQQRLDILQAICAGQVESAETEKLSMPLQAQLSRQSDCPIRRDVANVMKSIPPGLEDTVLKVEGKVPEDLRGTMLRVGPANFAVGNSQPFNSWLDGDGALLSISFADGAVFLKSRFVQTEGFVAERKAGRVLYRNIFGTEPRGGWVRNILKIRMKNTANTGVCFWRDQILAMWEGGRPHQLSPHTLDTMGEFSLNGLLSSGIPCDLFGEQKLDNAIGFGGDSWSGHPKFDGDTLINFGSRYRPSANTSVLKVYECFPDASEVSEFVLDGFPLFHDFLVTQSYYIFVENSVSMGRLADVLFGRMSPFDLFRFDGTEESLARIHLLPRKGSAAARRSFSFNVPGGLFGFHHISAVEENDGALRLYTLAMETHSEARRTDRVSEWDLFNVPSTPCCILVDAEKDEATLQRLSTVAAEFPVRCPKGIESADEVFFCGVGDGSSKARAIPMGYAKLKIATGRILDSWWPEGRCFVGEGVFVPRIRKKIRGGRKEDDGWFIGFM